MAESSWTVGPVHQAPSLVLHLWSVMEIQDGLGRPWTRHLLGIRTAESKVRVSTAIEVLDPVTRRALTRSGRVYELAQGPGFSEAGLAAWEVWKARYGIEEERDVTEKVQQLLHLAIN